MRLSIVNAWKAFLTDAEPILWASSAIRIVPFESFFNDTHPYTYSFSMSRAIKEECLMPYYYFPYLVKLEEDEMVEYAKITRQLVQMYNNNKGGFFDSEKARKLLLF